MGLLTLDTKASEPGCGDGSIERSSIGSAPKMTRTEIIVVGAGLAGTCAATALAKAGHAVTMVETTAKVPPTLRAEKLGGEALDLFERLGLAETFRSVATPIYSIWIAQFGRLMTRCFKREYGFAYGALVSKFRDDLPASVDLRIGRIVEATCSPDRQRVVLADGTVLEGRLLVVATGQGGAIKRKLGIGTSAARSGHSMCIGFDVDRPRCAFPFESLVYYGERREDRVAYVSLFPIGLRMRANLFVYRSNADPWAKAFRAAPAATLRETLPRLESVCGPIEIAGAIDMRPIDLTRSEGYERDGVVLIGDAFCNSCPITGTGMRKALVDVERLTTHHVPTWLATPGMGVEKIGQFYADAVKTGFDAASLRDSDKLRGIKLGRGREWALSRARSGFRRRVTFAVHRAANIAATMMGTLSSLV